MAETNKENNKVIKDIQEKVGKIIDADLIQEALMNNKVEFEYNKVKYKLSKPSFKQKQEANQKRIEKFTELIKATDDKGSPKYMTEEDLIVTYQKRGIDIKAMDKKYNNLDTEKRDYMFKLGEAIKNKKPENELKKYQEEINQLEFKQKEIGAKKAILLDTCIETQIIVYVYSYLSFLITEKYDEKNKKWVQAWSNYEDFINTDETLINKTTYYVTLLARNELSLF